MSKTRRSTQPVRRKRKVKRRVRHLRKPVLYGLIGLIVVVIAIVGIFTVPKMLQNNDLKKLGYDKATITEIRNQKLTKTILKNEYYSENLASSIVGKTLNKDYIQLYAVSDSTGDNDIKLYDRLQEMGYTEEQVLSLFDKLKFYEISPLLVFDFQTDLQPYIDDCIANADKNSQTHFSLTNSYRVPYGTTLPVNNPGSYDMLVNKTYYLDSSYVPSQVTDLSIRYAASGLQLESSAAEALKELCEAGKAMGLTVYASSAFRNYEHQENLYNRYVKANGAEEADRTSARPGFSEHQTGLCVDLAAGGENEGLGSFKDTDEFVWTAANSAEYGWILRYPEGKEQITGYDYEPWHYRYVGKDIAQKVVASGLTYDEYYMLFIASPPVVETPTK